MGDSTSCGVFFGVASQPVILLSSSPSLQLRGQRSLHNTRTRYLGYIRRTQMLAYTIATQRLVLHTTLHLYALMFNMIIFIKEWITTILLAIWTIAVSRDTIIIYTIIDTIIDTIISSPHCTKYSRNTAE